MKQTYQFTIDGMTCHACEALITMDIEDIGEKPLSITHNPGMLTIELDETHVEQVRAAIEREGKYRVTAVQKL